MGMYVAVRGWLGFDHQQRQLAELARLDPADGDMDMPAGFFLLSDEWQHSTSWIIRDGLVVETLAPPELHWFAERP